MSAQGQCPCHTLGETRTGAPTLGPRPQPETGSRANVGLACKLPDGARARRRGRVSAVWRAVGRKPDTEGPCGTAPSIRRRRKAKLPCSVQRRLSAGCCYRGSARGTGHQPGQAETATRGEEGPCLKGRSGGPWGPDSVLSHHSALAHGSLPHERLIKFPRRFVVQRSN